MSDVADTRVSLRTRPWLVVLHLAQVLIVALGSSTVAEGVIAAVHRDLWTALPAPLVTLFAFYVIVVPLVVRLEWSADLLATGRRGDLRALFRGSPPTSSARAGEGVVLRTAVELTWASAVLFVALGVERKSFFVAVALLLGWHLVALAGAGVIIRE